MLITTPWLEHYLEPTVPPDALMDAFPKMGFEIESSSKMTQYDGYVVDLNVLANRPDCLGFVGIAREVAAHFNVKLKYPPMEELAGGSSELKVGILDPDLCPRYMGRVMTGVKVEPSPKWLSDALVSINQRPINNVVDITNFVMFEFGQPLHAFDFTKIGGRKIVVRKMQPGEKLELLTGKVIDAGDASAPPTLAICDADRPVALAGIMGGKHAETSDQSTEILIEAANFDAPTIRRTGKRLELLSEARFRFERGVDPNSTLERAMNRCCALIAELCGGKPAGASVDDYPKRREPCVFALSTQRVSSYLGKEIDAQTIKSSLTKLEMKVDDKLNVEVPTWRIDAVDPVVLIEDIARLVGYDNLPERPTPQAPTMGRRSPLDQLRQQLAEYFASTGWFECRSPSLDVPEQIDALDPDASKSIVKLKNPMNREASIMRTSLLPALVRVAERNARRGAATARFFEMDKVYRKLTDDPNQPGAIETPMCAGVAGGELNEFDWTGRNPQISFFDVKGAIEDVLELTGVRDATFEPVARRGFSGDVSMAIVSASDRANPIGYLGQVDPKVLPVEKTPFKLFGFELNLPELLKTHATVTTYRQLSRTPASDRDLAIVVRQGESFANIERTIRASAGPALESLRMVDLYEGKQVPPGHRSLAFRLIFRDPTRTLTADEVQAQVDGIVAALRDQFGATLRA